MPSLNRAERKLTVRWHTEASMILVLLASGAYAITGTAPAGVMMKPPSEQIMVAFSVCSPQ